MSPKERALTTGFLINKFRGDPQLFSSGIAYIEDKTRKPVLGLIPFYHDICIDHEDSVAVQEDRRSLIPLGPDTVNVAALKLPAISNFTDLACLETEPDVIVNYLRRPRDLSKDYDCFILPGTKNVMEDAAWIAGSGWNRAIRRFAERGGPVFGICGGYQLMGAEIRDPSGVESQRKMVRGIGLLPVNTELGRKKVVREVTGSCLLNGKRVRGYEIHMGSSSVLEGPGKPYLRIRKPGDRHAWEDGWCTVDGRLAGTYVHGILDSPGFRAAFLNDLRKGKGLKERAPGPGRRRRFRQYDRLADHFERHCDVDKILSFIGTAS